MSDNHKTIQYNLRMTEEMRERIKQSAQNHNRTMNQDIIARLEQSFNPPVSVTLPQFIERGLMKNISKQYQNLQDEIKQKFEALNNLDPKEVEEFIESKLNKKPT